MGFETFWASNGALVHNGDVIAASVREAARRAGGMVARERYADADVVGPLDAAGTLAQGGSSIAAIRPTSASGCGSMPQAGWPGRRFGCRRRRPRQRCCRARSGPAGFAPDVRRPACWFHAALGGRRLAAWDDDRKATELRWTGRPLTPAVPVWRAPARERVDPGLVEHHRWRCHAGLAGRRRTRHGLSCPFFAHRTSSDNGPPMFCGVSLGSCGPGRSMMACRSWPACDCTPNVMTVPAGSRWRQCRLAPRCRSAGAGAGAW